jgi:hypothetical protein
MDIAQNLIVHTPVQRAGRLDSEYVEALQKIQWKDIGLVGQAFAQSALSSQEIVNDFNKCAEKATFGRSGSSSDTFRFHVFYKSGDFFTGKIKNGEKMESLRTALINDIEKNNRILSVQAK